jgi:hypothetical protein
MVTDHSRRAAVMYPNKTAAPETARSPATTGRAAAGAILYGSNKSGHTGSIDNAIRSTFDKIEASARGDAERLKQVQTTRDKVRGLLEKANVAPADAHTMLSVYGEYHTYRRSEESLAKNWEGPHGFDRLRREAGSTEAALAQVQRTELMLNRIKQDDPIFAADLVRTGASQDPRFIQTAAKIVDALQPAKQS